MSFLILTRDMIADLVVWHTPTFSMVGYVTDCCHASVTGTVDGVACRACYTPVTDDHGYAWELHDTPSWEAWAGRNQRTDLDVIRVRAEQGVQHV